jgi:GDPmannose 4,6-dehydratase
MMVNSYRESYGMFVCAGILFNHESPRRSLHFVTRKVTVAVACIKNKPASVPLGENGKLLIDADGKLHLGDLLSQRDWGYAKDYVEAMWLMLQRDTPKDYVIGTGESHSVKELCEVAFARAGLNWEDYVVSSSDFMRPTEIKYLRADSRLALKELGWKPTTSFKDLIELMVDEDLKAYK